MYKHFCMVCGQITQDPSLCIECGDFVCNHCERDGYCVQCLQNDPDDPFEDWGYSDDEPVSEIRDDRARPRPVDRADVVPAARHGDGMRDDMSATRETAYRLEDKLVSVVIDAEREIFGSRVEVWTLKYDVVRHTPKGFWITLGFGDRRFVLRGARKKYACLTLEEAKQSFLARKKRQRRILQARLDRVTAAECLAESIRQDC